MALDLASGAVIDETSKRHRHQTVFSNPDMGVNEPVGGAEGGCEGEW